MVLSARMAKDEQDPGDEAAGGALEEPPEVDGELLCLRAGQQHAVVEGVEEATFAEPAAIIHELAVHDRDLASRAAEGLQRDPEPGPYRLAKWDDVIGGGDGAIRHRTSLSPRSLDHKISAVRRR